MKRIQNTDAARTAQSGVRQRRIRLAKKRQARREPPPLDLRTPSGQRRLPY